MSPRTRQAASGNGASAGKDAGAGVLTRPDRQTAGDQAEEALLEAIMDGTIPPGSALRLHDLASQLGMSIMPVREALRRLEGLGLVEIVAHKGAWVRSLTLEDLHDTYFTRLHLECLAMRTAADRFGDDDAARARSALDEHAAMLRRGDDAAVRNAHERFHFALYRACGSEWLVRSIGPAWRNSERYRVRSVRSTRHLARCAREHEQMLEALSAGDGEQAAALLHAHLLSSAELIAKELAPESGGAPMPLPSLGDLLLSGRT